MTRHTVTPDDIPPSITALADTCPFWINPSSTPKILAHFWPEIEQHIRGMVAQEIEQHIRIWEGMGASPAERARGMAYAADIARGTTEENPR